jgi:hypothetical protein
MKYSVLKGCVIGGARCNAGSVVDIDEKEAKELMLMGRIVPANEKPVVENRSVGLEESVEQPRTRGRKKKAN